jgi:hypothetical protein
MIVHAHTKKIRAVFLLTPTTTALIGTSAVAVCGRRPYGNLMGENVRPTVVAD